LLASSSSFSPFILFKTEGEERMKKGNKNWEKESSYFVQFNIFSVVFQFNFSICFLVHSSPSLYDLFFKFYNFLSAVILILISSFIFFCHLLLIFLFSLYSPSFLLFCVLILILHFLFC
jgi:hypothetical protein